jgi:hypothetical protein
MKTKLILIVFLFACMASTSFSQVPSWIWAHNATGADDDEGYGIATDLNGNIFISGIYLSDTIRFDTTALFPRGIFLTKYNADGNVLWAKRADPNTLFAPNKVATDRFGNCYLTGYFYSQVIFGIDTLNAVQENIYLVKYNSSGDLVWAKSAGGNLIDQSSGIATDDSGNIYITGNFTSTTIFFGGISITKPSNTGTDVFVAKYDSSGTAVWAKRLGGSDSEFGNSIAVDANHNVFVTGSYLSPSITFGSSTLINAGGASDDFFIAKFDSVGNPSWAKGSSGSTVSDGGSGVATDYSGNIYATGYFSGITISFGAAASITTAGGFFLVKYNSAGTALWARNPSMGGGEGRALAIDAAGSVYVTGNYYPTITFGSSTLSNTGATNLFVVKYNSSGTPQWAKNAFATSSTVIPGSIALDTNNTIYVAGSFFSPTVQFGIHAIVNSGSSGEVFIARLGLPNVDVNEIAENENELSAYPNPSNGSVRINFQKASPVARLAIINMLGKKIVEENLNGSDGNYSRDFYLQLQAGIYFVTVADGEKNYTRKLVVE